MNTSNKSRAVVALFFLSGLSSLVLETVWVRQMVLVFGSTTFAVSTVLTAFMAGLALGSFLAGRWVTRKLSSPRSALAVYALLELGIGLYALTMPALAAKLPDLHQLLWGSLHGSYLTFSLIRFILAAALLALPTLAMGATLPVLVHYLAANQDRSSLGKTVGTLYAVNTTGAVAGVFLAGFLLLPGIGLWATNLSACLTDLVLAAAAAALYYHQSPSTAPEPERVAEDVQRAADLQARRRTDPEDGPSQPEPEPAPAPAPANSRIAHLALFSVAVSGTLAMVNQVAWTRSLSLVIGSSTYAFSLILLAFLLGLAVGAALYARRQAGDADQPANLAVIFLLSGVACAFGPLVAMDRLPVFMLALLQRIPLTPSLVFGLKFVLAGTVIFLPTFFMGMVFPAVVQIYAGQTRHGAGQATGTVYAANTMGAILGSFAGGFIMIPVFGLRRTLLIMVAAILLLGLLFSLAAAKRRTRIILSASGVLLLAGLIPLARPWNLELLTAGVFRVSRYAGDGQVSSSRIAGGKAQPQGTKEDEGEADRRYLTWLEAARALIPPALTPDSFQEPRSSSRIVRHAEGVTTTVSIAREVDFSLSSKACWVRSSLLVNGKPDASLSVLHPEPPGGCHLLAKEPGSSAIPGGISLSPQGDTETQLLSGLLPYLLYQGPGSPEKALIIGWGSGVTVGAALASPVKQVDAAELEREVVEAARLFEPFNGAPQQDPRLKLMEADGRNVLASSGATYDIIISEPSNPWISGCGNLFTQEFFRLVRSHLSNDGVFLQWVQAYEISPENVWSMLATISGEFPQVYVFSPSHARSDLLIVARKAMGSKVPWPWVESRMKRPQVQALLKRLGIEGPADLAVRLLAGPDGVRKVSQGAPVNTDDNARIEFNAPKDLINFRQFRSSTIIKKLESTLKAAGPARGLFRKVPPDAGGVLCRAAIKAGRQERIPRQGKDEDSGLTRCRQLAGELSRPLPPLDARWTARVLAGSPLARQILAVLSRPDSEAIQDLTALIPPGGTVKEQHILFSILGHLSARNKAHFDSLAFLLAARQLQGRTEEARYPFADRVLAHELTMCGLHQEALLILDLTK